MQNYFKNISLPKVHFFFAGLIVANLFAVRWLADSFKVRRLNSNKEKTHELFRLGYDFIFS
ncbi:MAG: hypothetical protein DRI95_10055 [Bacteroidetes bacterium]|nr:MAG: hypothetical protein DRI95_10055 [Bacteroidota bacterium]